MSAFPPSMTVVVPTYQRREAVLRLLAAFASELEGPAGAGVDVLVVVDGSEDGTFEAVGAMPYPVPLRAVRQTNSGPSVTRNHGLREARGEVVWFVDDDMVPSPGLLERHRRHHAEGHAGLVMGPCLHPPDGAQVTGPIRAYAERWFGALARAGEVTAPFDFSAANTSGRASAWRGVGGFEERLRGWGGEDYEIGFRLLRAGIPIRFDPEAVAWHHQVRTVGEFCTELRQQGRNLVRIAELHPDALDDLIPVSTSGRVLTAVHRLGRRHRGAYGAAARAFTLAARAEGRLAPGRPARVLHLAERGSQLAGVADLDERGSYVARYFGAGPPP